MWRVLIDIHGKFFMDKLKEKRKYKSRVIFINHKYNSDCDSSTNFYNMGIETMKIKLYYPITSILLPNYVFFQIHISMINVRGTFCKNQSLNMKIGTSSLQINSFSYISFDFLI